MKILNTSGDIVFFTPWEMQSETMMVDEAKRAGYRILTIPNNLKQRIQNKEDINGETIKDLGQFSKEYEKSFEFKFIDYNNLTTSERKVIDET